MYFAKRKLQPLSFIFVLTSLMIIIAGCHFRTSSVGVEGSILIIADELDRPVIRSEIENRFGRIIYTPQPEQLFKISWTDGEDLKNKTNSPLLLMAATTDGNGPTATLLKRMISQEINSGIENGEYFVFKRVNPWSTPQLLIILIGRNQRELGENARQWGDSMFNWAYEFEKQRVTDQMFRKGEQKSLEAEIKEEFGFDISIQHDYIIAQKNDSLNFVRFIRHYPERWVTIAMGSLDADSLFNPDFIFRQREKIGAHFLDPVMLYPDRWTWSESSVGDVPAIRIDGLWATLDPTGGGPFFCYGLWFPAEKKYYIIDGAVFAPGENKIPFLWQLNSIAQSFKWENGG